MSSLARGILEKMQARDRQDLGLGPQATEAEVIERALQQAKQREEQAVRDGDILRVGYLKYPAVLEELRWRRTREIIQRVRPGGDEDPIYLEMLARQAASFEIIMRQEYTGSPNPEAAALCDRILLGTTVRLEPLEESQPAGDDFLVILSYGFLTFLYQAAKAVILSWQPKKPGPGKEYGFGVSPEDTDEVLKKNPYPLELLFKTLEGYLFHGKPRAVGYDPPPPNYQGALEQTIDSAERFVIAHEYGHAVLQQLPSFYSIPPDDQDWSQEFGADYLAFHFNILSGQELDHWPANIGLQGGFFTLTALEALRRTLDLVRYGQVQEDEGDKSHPPIQERLAFLKERYRQEVYNGTSEGEEINLEVEGALLQSNTLRHLWNLIHDRFPKKQGDKLHPIWK
jgi:hypothetical protein